MEAAAVNMDSLCSLLLQPLSCLQMGHFRRGKIFFVILPIDRKFSDFMCENMMWQQHYFLILQLGLFELNNLGRKTLKRKRL